MPGQALRFGSACKSKICFPEPYSWRVQYMEFEEIARVSPVDLGSLQGVNMLLPSFQALSTAEVPEQKQ